MTFRLLPVAVALVAAGCSEIPKDPDETLERIRRQQEFRVGIIAPGADGGETARQRLLLARVARSTGARPRIVTGASEKLLEAIEMGELDLVVGELAQNSPWRKRVTLLPPLEPKTEGENKSQSKLHAVARNGENAWISLLYREAKAVSGAGA